jgi:hypothetical protein
MLLLLTTVFSWIIQKVNYKPSYKFLERDRAEKNCTYTTHDTIDISVKGHHDGTYRANFEYIPGFVVLDECSGITFEEIYLYLVISDFPYISRCLMGDYEEERSQADEGQRPSAT